MIIYLLLRPLNQRALAGTAPMRHLVSGGSLAAVWQGSAVLLAFLAGALMLTTLPARQNRVWTMKRLHPVLKL
jgi:putative membrane protein